VLLAEIEQASTVVVQLALIVAVVQLNLAGIYCQIEQIEVQLDLTEAEEELLAGLVSAAGPEEHLL